MTEDSKLSDKIPQAAWQCILGIVVLVPVLVAHQYNFDGGRGTVASAAISVFLWLVFFAMMTSPIEGQTSRLLVRIFLFTLLGFYFFGQLASYYLQGSYFNRQYFFHLNISTLTETWGAYYLQFLGFALWLAGLWTVLWFTRASRELQNRSAALALGVLLLAIAADPGLRSTTVLAARSVFNIEEDGLVSVGWDQLDIKDNILQDANLDSIDWDGMNLNRAALEPGDGQVTPGKNLLMIFLEGFDQLYTDESAFPGLTPNLSALNQDGWQLQRLTQIPGSSWTMGGLVSSLCGTPLLHQWHFGNNNIMFTSFLNRARCLPDILHSAGYEQTFMGGASLKFAGKGNFLKQHSFDNVYGRTALKKRLPDPSNLGGWGLYDDNLFDIAAEEYQRLAAQDKPFNLTVLTVDTHHPRGERSKSCIKYPTIDNTILHAVHCTDQLVGNFIERVRQFPAYQDTLVVILADHLAMRNNAFPLFPKGYRRTLYFNVLNSENEGSSDTLATPTDIAPTVLNLMGVEHGTSFLAGDDVSGEQNEPWNLQPWNPAKAKTLGFLNSNVLTSDIQKDRPSIVFKFEDIKFAKDISDLELSSDKATFLVTGDKSYLELPKVTNSSGGGVPDSRPRRPGYLLRAGTLCDP